MLKIAVGIRMMERQRQGFHCRASPKGGKADSRKQVAAFTRSLFCASARPRRDYASCANYANYASYASYADYYAEILH